jgi:hypothetical protein
MPTCLACGRDPFSGDDCGRWDCPYILLKACEFDEHDDAADDEAVNRLTSEDPEDDDDESPGTCDEMSQWDLDGEEPDDDDEDE